MKDCRKKQQKGGAGAGKRERKQRQRKGKTGGEDKVKVTSRVQRELVVKMGSPKGSQPVPIAARQVIFEIDVGMWK